MGTRKKQRAYRFSDDFNAMLKRASEVSGLSMTQILERSTIRQLAGITAPAAAEMARLSNIDAIAASPEFRAGVAELLEDARLDNRARADAKSA